MEGLGGFEMKKLIFAMVAAAGALAFAAETKPVAAKPAAAKPAAEKPKYVDPNPFADYGVAMRDNAKSPFAVGWSQAHDAEIKAATEEDVLAACVADAASAAALLGKIKPAYESDPLVLTQIAAVTQWVMTDDPCFLCFWKPSPSAGRKVWTEALVRKIAESKDDYIRTFCRQQLDLCK